MQITAAVLSTTGAPTPYATSQPLHLTQLQLDPPGPGEVLVAVTAAGLCHSDLSVINGNRVRPTPMALGHEATGVVLESVPAPGASGAHDLRPGDHVVFVFVPSCGHCEPCASGRPALCEPGAVANGAGTLLSGQRRLHTLNGQDVHHHLGVSAFADHAVVSRASLVKVDPDLPAQEAALFGCAVLTGVGAVFNTARLQPGSSAAVVGLGGVGLSSLLGALAAGARTVVAVDLSEDKLALADKLGATHTVNAADPQAAEQVRALTNGGVDYAFEMAGSARALDLAFTVTRRGGTTVTAGLTAPDARLPLSPLTLVAEERTLKGSYIGTAVPARDIPRYIELYRRGRLPVDQLLSSTSTLEQINHGFDLLESGQAVRHVVTMSAAGAL